jgi:hypothetical protein
MTTITETKPTRLHTGDDDGDRCTLLLLIEPKLTRDPTRR